MNPFIRSALAGSLLLAFVVGCSGRDERRQITGTGEAASDANVREARWITELDALRSAVRSASASPIVKHVVASIVPTTQAQFVPEGTAHAVATLSDGSHVRITILPFGFSGDDRHATFVTLLERDTQQVAQATEVIAGREPLASETGFELESIGGRRFWFRELGEVSTDATGRVQRSPQRTINKEFFRCFVRNTVAGCGVVVAGCRDLAMPNYVSSCMVVGCAVVAVLAAVGCAVGVLR